MDREPILKTIGHKQLVSMITPDEVTQTKPLLEQFFTDYKLFDAKLLATLAYLIGIKQGVHEMQGETNKGKSLAEQLLKVYNIGKLHGFNEGVILVTKEARAQIEIEVNKANPARKAFQ